MMGLMVLGFFAVYLALLVWAVKAASGWAKTNNKKPWLWGGLAAFVMYNLVFWDWIPTVVAHKYYCSTEAGFWVYKTVDQWKKENPGVIETLVSNDGAPSRHEEFNDGHGKTSNYLLNERFNWIVTQQDITGLLPIIRTEQQVKDIQKNEVLARYVDFGTGNSVKNTIGSPGPLKFWMDSGHCGVGGNNQGLMHSFEHNVTGIEK